MLSCGEGRCEVHLRHFEIGNDCLIIITGGDEHIGAVSLLENGHLSTIGKKGHKDDIISNMVISTIYDSLKKDVAVLCGIHIDDATKEEIGTITQNVQSCVEEFLHLY